MPDPTTQSNAQEVSVRDRDHKFDRVTNATHRFRFIRNLAHILEVEDLHFHHDSAVMLPDYAINDANVDAADDNHVSGLDVIRAAYLHAERMPSAKLLIAGHTDRSGSADYNLTLSDQRGANVTMVLMGNRDAWADICDEKHKVEDYQQILIWIKDTFGWDTDPGPKNNVNNAKTQAAVKKFQERHNVETSEGIGEDGIVGPETWRAFFTMYMKHLAKLMKTDEPGLVAERDKLSFLDDAQAYVGCGENFPVTPDLVANQKSQVDRRVHLLYFDPPDVPDMQCHPHGGKCDASKCQIYGANRIFRFDPLPAQPDDVGRNFRIVLEYGDIDKLFPDIAVMNDQDDGIRRRLQAIGFLYEPLNSADITAASQAAWKHFKEVFSKADDATGVEELRAQVRKIILDDNKLPETDEVNRIRFPGTWCITNGDRPTFFGSPGTPAGTPHKRFTAEKAVWDANDRLGLLPIIAKVEQRDGENWGPATTGIKVHFQLVKPGDIPAGSFGSPGAQRATPVVGSTNSAATPPSPRTFNMTGNPKLYIDTERARNAPAADDPQIDNAHNTLGGKRGNAVCGDDRFKNIFETGKSRAGFHDTLHLSPADISSHANAAVATTNDDGKACVVFMPSRLGGDRYRIRAFLDPIPEQGDDQASDGTEALAVKTDTGDFVTFRILRVSKYMRWDYPGAAVNPTHAGDFAACGGALDAFDIGGFIADEFSRGWMDVLVETKAQTPQNITQAEWLTATKYAKGRISVAASLSQKYNVNVLIAETSPVTAGTNNSSSGIIQLLNAAEYDAAAKGPPPAGGWPAATGNANFYSDCAVIMHAMSEELVHFYSRNAISGVTVMQVPTMTSLEAREGTAMLADPSTGHWMRSGWGGMYRGCYVAFGTTVYSNAGFPYAANSNAMHEMGHTLYCPHQYTDGSQVNVGAGGKTGGGFDEHDYHDLCVMGYMSRRPPPGTADYCGRCLLLFAGWDTHAMPVNAPGP